MPTKRQPESPLNAHQKSAAWAPPKGIRYEHRDGRRKPFYLFWRVPGEKNEKAQSFADEAAREKVAKAMAEKKAEHGNAILGFDPVKWRRWLEFEHMVGGADPLRVAAEWLAQRTGSDAAADSSKTVAAAWQEYRQLRETEDKLSADTWRHIDSHVGVRFVGSFGPRRLNTLTAGDIRAWLAGLRSSRSGEAMTALTQRHHRKDVNTFLDRCQREGWMRGNPCDLVTPPAHDDDGEVTVISARDAFHFFKANAAEPVAIRVALEAFGGVRYSTAGRISFSNFNFAERGIEMPGAIHKSGKRKFRQGHPAVLWRWLDLAKDAKHPAWSLDLRQYREGKKHGRIRANVETPRNVWRHSFASYHLAHGKDLPRTGYLMQHRHTATTEIYEGVATERDARLYLAITPESVKLSWDEFCAGVP